MKKSFVLSALVMSVVFSTAANAAHVMHCTGVSQPDDAPLNSQNRNPIRLLNGVSAMIAYDNMEGTFSVDLKRADGQTINLMSSTQTGPEQIAAIENCFESRRVRFVSQSCSVRDANGARKTYKASLRYSSFWTEEGGMGIHAMVSSETRAENVSTMGVHQFIGASWSDNRIYLSGCTLQ